MIAQVSFFLLLRGSLREVLHYSCTCRAFHACRGLLRGQGDSACKWLLPAGHNCTFLQASSALETHEGRGKAHGSGVHLPAF